MRLLTETTIHRLPTVLLNNKLTIMAKITLAQATMDTDAQVQALAMNALMKGAQATPDEDNVVYTVGDTKLSLDVAKFVVSVGGDVSEFPLFIEVVPTDSVPEGIPERTVTAEDGTVTVKTWEEWSPIDTRDGRTFVEADNGQTRLKMSELVPVFDSLVRAIDLPNNPE